MRANRQWVIPAVIASVALPLLFAPVFAGSVLPGKNHHDHSRQCARRRRRNAHQGGGKLSKEACSGKSDRYNRVHGGRRRHQGRQPSLSRRARRRPDHWQRAERHGVVCDPGRGGRSVRSRQIHLSRLAEQRIALCVFHQSETRFGQPGEIARSLGIADRRPDRWPPDLSTPVACSL